MRTVHLVDDVERDTEDGRPPASISTRPAHSRSACWRMTLITTKKSRMPSAISAKRRMVVTLGRALAAPKAKAKTATSRKTATNRPMGEPTKRRSLPVNRPTTQTKTNEASGCVKESRLEAQPEGEGGEGQQRAVSPG